VDAIQESIAGYRVFFFDLDGTLVDSTALHARAFRAALGSDDGTFNYDDYKGMKTSQVFAALGYGERQRKELTEKKQSLYRASVKNGEIGIFPYALELLKSLSLKGRRSFLVTGGSSHSVSQIVNFSKIGSYIHGYICGDEVEESKPSPEIYLKALTKFNCRPEEVLAVEDSHNGILSAISAGIRTISVNDDVRHRLVHLLSLRRMYELIQ
jgi:beta-phosphoglucomutase